MLHQQGGFVSSSWFLCWRLWYSASFLFQQQRNIMPFRSPYLSFCSNIKLSYFFSKIVYVPFIGCLCAFLPVIMVVWQSKKTLR